MQIVINIPEAEYNYFKNSSFVEDEKTLLYKSTSDRKGTMSLFRLIEAIKNGTLLPKGHGNLKDMGNIRYIFDLTKTEPTYTGKDIELAIKSMPTVLEADKEVE